MSRYQPDHASFARFMVSRQIQKPIHDVAEAVKADAITLTPEATGALKSDYKVNDIAPVTVNGAPRAASEVRNSNPAAAPVEFGGKRNAAVRPLGRAAAHHGDVKGAG